MHSMFAKTETMHWCKSPMPHIFAEICNMAFIVPMHHNKPNITYLLCRNMNHVLTSLLTSLQRPYTSPLQCTLVSEVLKACPDQLVWYLPSLKHALAPRASTNWIQAMQLLHKVRIWRLFCKMIDKDFFRSANFCVFLFAIHIIVLYNLVSKLTVVVMVDSGGGWHG